MVFNGWLSKNVKEENNIGIEEIRKDLIEDGQRTSQLKHGYLLQEFVEYLKFKLKLNVYQLLGLHHRQLSHYLYCHSQCLLGQLPHQVLLRHHELQRLQQ